jgi:aconitase A
MPTPSQLQVGERSYEIFRLEELQAAHDVARLPYTLRIVLENVMRTSSEEDVDAVAGWVAADEPSREISFTPARVLLQDFTGVPAVVDLAAMRNAMQDWRSRATSSSSSSATASAMPSCAGARPRSATSRPSHPARASSTR